MYIMNWIMNLCVDRRGVKELCTQQQCDMNTLYMLTKFITLGIHYCPICKSSSFGLNPLAIAGHIMIHFLKVSYI